MDDRTIQQLIELAEARLEMHEYEFQSRVPLIGPLIAAARSAWNRVAGRQYVQYYANQQAALNRDLVNALRRIADAQQRQAADLAAVQEHGQRMEGQVQFLVQLGQLDLPALVKRCQNDEH